MNSRWDVIIIGAGAAGLLCAIEAGKRNRKVLVIDHANKPGKKILMSGGGRCNFTNLTVSSENYISHNPAFCRSALARYTPQDFIKMVNKHKIPYHEKTLGQLFCDNRSQDILNMLLTECQRSQVEIQLNTNIEHLQKTDLESFVVRTNQGEFECESLVVATGGLSIPTMGATPFGYKIAEQYGIKVWPTRAGLVPFTLQPQDKAKTASLSGVSVHCKVSTKRMNFSENLLFTHRGLSGPAILQISSYWEPGEVLNIDMISEIDSTKFLRNSRLLKTVLSEVLPKSVLEAFLAKKYADRSLNSLSNSDLKEALTSLQWKLKPSGTEGYRTAEVTLGGVDCDALSSKTFESKDIPGLFFIGEVVDVTGWLGGYNFQWAWSSGWAAGQVV